MARLEFQVAYILPNNPDRIQTRNFRIMYEALLFKLDMETAGGIAEDPVPIRYSKD
jgi:hypothetical protein